MSEPGSQDPLDEVLVDLLVKQATEGLSSAEQRALDALDSAAASAELLGFERAAAAVTLAGTASPTALPPALLARLEERARDFKRTDPRESRVVELQQPTVQPEARRAVRSGAAGWFAAAACLLLAVFAWLRTPEPLLVQMPPAPVQVPPEPPAPPQPPTMAQQRDTLMAAGALKVTLAATKDPLAAGVTGDVVWDPVSQRGFLHFVGLSANDPQVHQYQIWIFDGTRDQRYPVDGGVFDVPADASEIVIPIRASLAVRKPAAFAVTVEKPGGVVVSARGHVVALGAAG